ncbi:hypothetical protein ACQKKX_07230 [Neorhizobium sp. NPDC001467]|uniref:hypothetical protein n=1 Tax=Neorhizobium sp. NPDC001467 TaxID=3390595 RepID=UPI003CFCD2A7
MNRHVIEHSGLPVGIAIGQDDDYRFIAVKFPVIDLDGQRFTSLTELKDAIRRHLVRKNGALAA